MGKNSLLSLNDLSWVFWRWEIVLRVLRTTSSGDRRCSSPTNCLGCGECFTSLFRVFLPFSIFTGFVPSEMWTENISKILEKPNSFVFLENSQEPFISILRKCREKFWLSYLLLPSTSRSRYHGRSPPSHWTSVLFYFLTFPPLNPQNYFSISLFLMMNLSALGSF